MCVPSPAWGLQAIGSFNSFRTMAKSKVGGTRAYIRGRIGSDVYSVGKTAKGDRQQVIRSLAEQVSNPRTESQMFGRMIMSTVMQAVAGLAPIIDHSFDGFPKGQPSISEFIKENYALVKADAIAHPASGNKFGLKKYQEKGITGGQYVISKGKLVKSANIQNMDGMGLIALSADTMTVGGLKEAVGLSADGYITFVIIADVGDVKYLRVQITTTLADSTAITAENVASLFTLDGNVTVTPAIQSTTIKFELDPNADVALGGAIISDKVDGVWEHNTCQLKNGNPGDYVSDVALPTYPVGAAQFLNGGEI